MAIKFMNINLIFLNVYIVRKAFMKYSWRFTA